MYNKRYQITAHVDEVPYNILRGVLVHEHRSFSDWLRQKIDEDVERIKLTLQQSSSSESKNEL